MYVFNDKQRFIEILRFPFAERAPLGIIAATI